MKVQIKRKISTAHDIAVFELVDLNGEPLPVFSAGAHIDVMPCEGLTRQYSLCSSPADRSRFVIGVLLAPESSGGSAAMHALEEGAILQISEPKNHFPLEVTAEHSILIGGGIGITPLLCMAEHLLEIGNSFEMHSCTRSPERTPFRERLERADIKDHVHFYFDSAPANQRLNLRGVMESPALGKHLYVCGPSGFIDAVLDSAREAGWADGNLHREYFNNIPQFRKNDSAFEVKLASSGKRIVVPSHQTIVESLADHGIDVPVSCKQGVCGTCVTGVLDGEPDHRDFYLSSTEHEANDQIMPCCSRSKSPLLVLDL